MYCFVVFQNANFFLNRLPWQQTDINQPEKQSEKTIRHFPIAFSSNKLYYQQIIEVFSKRTQDKTFNFIKLKMDKVTTAANALSYSNI